MMQPMNTHRFGRRLKLLSTAAIKHQLLMMMFADEIQAPPPGETFRPDKSDALAKSRRLVARASGHAIQ
jgi:hypothetical protein